MHYGNMGLGFVTVYLLQENWDWFTPSPWIVSSLTSPPNKYRPCLRPKRCPGSGVPAGSIGRNFCNPAGSRSFPRRDLARLMSKPKRGGERRLFGEGQPAFFFELSELARSEVSGTLLAPEELSRVEVWRAASDEIATFFLDAYDELRLTRGKLRTALTRLEGIRWPKP